MLENSKKQTNKQKLSKALKIASDVLLRVPNYPMLRNTEREGLFFCVIEWSYKIICFISYICTFKVKYTHEVNAEKSAKVE